MSYAYLDLIYGTRRTISYLKYAYAFVFRHKAVIIVSIFDGQRME